MAGWMDNIKKDLLILKVNIEGYEDEKCQAKYQSVNNLVVIKDVSKEINYMTEKYGDDWLDKVCEKIYN